LRESPETTNAQGGGRGAAGAAVELATISSATVTQRPMFMMDAAPDPRRGDLT